MGIKNLFTIEDINGIEIDFDNIQDTMKYIKENINDISFVSKLGKIVIDFSRDIEGDIFYFIGYELVNNRMVACLENIDDFKRMESLLVWANTTLKEWN